MTDGRDNQQDKGAKNTPADIEPQLTSAQLAGLHQSAKLDTTLFDLAKHSLTERSQLSGEVTDKNHVYLELNRIMSLNSFKPANLGGKQDISDKDLPKSWNNVHSHQEFKLYDASAGGKPAADDPLAQLKEKLKQQIKDETSTVPVQLGEGYYQVWARMHPEQKAEDVNREAHRIKAINGNRDVLKVGERLPTATEEERERELQKRLQQAPPVKPPADQTPPADATPPGGKTPPVAPAKPGDKVPPGGPGTPGDKVPPAGTLPPGGPAKQPEKLPPPAPTAPAKPADSGPDLSGIYQSLLNQHNLASRTLAAAENGQGIVGKAFDAAKNTIGTSGEGRNWYDPRRVWSGLFDSDLGSKATDQKIHVEQAKLDRLKQAADSKDIGQFAAAYQDLTGHKFDPKDNKIAPVAGAQTAKAYDQSQHNGVDAITDIGVAVAVAATMRSGKVGATENLLRAMGTGAIVGGTAKVGLMQMDGRYANLRHDFTGGALMGATVPIGELGGSQLSKMLGKRLGMTVTGDLLTAKIETQGVGIGTKFLSAAAKSGTSGAIFGAIENPGRVLTNDLEQGREIRVSDLAAASLKGSVLGFIGGTALGAAVDGIGNGFKSLRPGSVTNAKTMINGVEVPSSGAVGLDQAAKILKMDPADFAKTAADQPYAAVGKAVKLYENTGLNIQKVDPLTGQSVLPEQFHDALSTVQNVDVLTSDAALKLSGKVKVVEATDQFLKSNPAAVDEPMTRVVADPNYQEVVKLKTAQDGQPAADAFAQDFQKGFAKDLKTSMAVQQVKVEGLQPADALKTSQPEVEAAYKQKAADYFKDMTDPAQRARLNDLVDDIYGKFNPESLSKTDLEAILGAVPPADRELAVALLHESAGTSSDTLLKGRLQALESEISKEVGQASPSNVYTLAPDSSANLLGYLYRKSNSISMSMNNIDRLASDVASGHTPNSVVLFDDLSSTPISQANMALLKKIPHVFVVDVGAFEKAVNIIDLSKGPQAVAEKLSGLLEEARTIRASNPGLLASGVARETMQSGVDAAAKSIGENVKIIRPSGNVHVTGAASADGLAQMNDVDALYAQYNVPKASKDQIASFLSGYVGQERELAARMLSEGAVHNSFPVMVKKAIDLHSKIADALGKSGMKMSDLLVVPDKDPGGSSHLISYLFGKANGLSPENFVSTQRLNQMISSGAVNNKAIAYFDDTIYSGSQASGMLDSNVSSLMPFKKVVVASLGAYDKGVQSIKGTHLGSLGKVEVATSSMHQPFYSQAHPFYSQLGASQQYAVKNIGGAEGFGSVQGSLIWSYMYPDNNLSFFGSKFAGQVLHLPGS